MPDAPISTVAIASRKSSLRATLRARRRALGEDERNRFDASINRAVVQLALDHPHGAVAGFRAFDGEPDLSAALAELAGLQRPLALPVLVERPSGGRLEFRAWNPGAILDTNRFGIAEPRAGSRVPIEAIGLVLVPLVGWDEYGGRLGMGAGYYDRALADVTHRSQPARAGIAYGIQRVDRVPTDEHDVPLHVVITESGRFTCPP